MLRTEPFNNLSERNVSDLINNSAKKSCVLAPMPTCLIYDSLKVLLPVITRMVNVSLSTGHFTDERKEADRGRDSYMEHTGMLVGNFEFNP